MTPSGRQAIGLLEVHGLAAALAAADAMAKAAPVETRRGERIGDGLVTLIVAGEISAVLDAIDAGAAAAAPLGRIVSRRVIGRPADDLDDIFGLA